MITNHYTFYKIINLMKGCTMTNNLTKLTKIEAIFFMVILTVNRFILNLPQKILSSCGSSSILNVIYISMIAIIFTIIISKLFSHFSNCDIIDVSEYVGGKVLRIIIGLFLITYLILVVGASLRDFCEILYITYYGKTRIIYLIMFFIITSALANYFGEPSIIKTNVIISVVILISLGIAYLSVIPDFVVQRIFPILGFGAYETFFSGLSNLTAFNSLLAIYIIMPMLAEKKDFRKLSIISVVIISIFLIASITCLLLSVSISTNIDNISPIYTLIAHTNFSESIQHPEPLFIFTWILSIISYINIVVMLIIRFLKKITNFSNQNAFIIPICIVILIVSLMPKNLLSTHNMENFLFNYIFLPMIFIIFPLILIIGNLKLKKKNHNNYERT